MIFGWGNTKIYSLRIIKERIKALRLRWLKNHLSIGQFNSYELPDFSIITGLNGSGKTHLLNAIQNGAVQIVGQGSDMSLTTSEISYYNFNSLSPNNSEDASFNVSNVYQQFLDRLDELKFTIKQNYIVTFQRLGLNDYDDYFDFESFKLTQDIDSLDIKDNIKEELIRTIPSIEMGLVTDLKSRYQSWLNISKLSFNELIKISNFNIHKISLINTAPSIFQQSFSQLFLRYQDLITVNKLIKLDFEEKGDGPKPLSDEEFISTHGEPPWKIVNGILKDAGLDFHITHPEGHRLIKFMPKLLKLSTGQEVKFNTLSSGEKILMSFAFCVFYSIDDRNTVNKPKLLLLDEVDASLHPKMSKQLLDVIVSNIVQRQGIKVIMATHSPSTVALAPDDALMVKKQGSSVLEPISKDEALNILTSGIPTLSIDISGRKQVFVESKNDEHRFSHVYTLLKPLFNSPFSLNFIAVGSKKSNGMDIDSGCERVTSLVKSLRDSGNKNIYGLIDWDCNSSDKRNESIHVLGYGNWYSIENCLLDPLVLLLYIVRDFKGIAHKFGIPDHIHYVNFLKSDQRYIQDSVNKLQSELLGFDVSEDKVEKIEFEYQCGIKLMIAKNYCHYRGHDLADLIISKLDPFKQFEGNADKLLSKIISHVFKEQEGSIPLVLIDDFSNLLSK